MTRRTACGTTTNRIVCPRLRPSADALETEFVCIPRPFERNEAPDGGPVVAN